MSLINEMLRDLEARKASDSIKGEQLFAQPGPRTKSARFRSFALLVGVLSALGLAWSLFLRPETPQSLPVIANTPTTTPIPSENPDSNNQIQLTQITPPPAPPVPPAVMPTPPSPAPSSIETIASNPVTPEVNPHLSPTPKPLVKHRGVNQSNQAKKKLLLASAQREKQSKVNKSKPKRLPAKARTDEDAPQEQQNEFITVAPATPDLTTHLSNAKNLISQKQPQQAIKLLKSLPTQLTRTEAYDALLAAAYQQTNQSQAAASTYQQLLRKRPHKAEYWLGLGLAEEQNGNKANARQAYTQALHKKSLDDSVVRYINQRVTELNSE